MLGNFLATTGGSMGIESAQFTIDLNDPVYKKLVRFGSRIGHLLSRPTIKANPHLLGTLDDSLGVIYALILAKHGEFEDRTKRSIEVAAVQRRAAASQTGAHFY
jgi:hypothetical protein